MHEGTFKKGQFVFEERVTVLSGKMYLGLRMNRVDFNFS